VTLEGIFNYMELLRTSFGTENAPMTFSRFTAATTYPIDEDLNQSEWYPLQQGFRELMEADGITRVPEQDIEPTIPSKKSRAARKNDELEASWRNAKQLRGLVAVKQILQPGSSTARDADGKLYTLANYLDDCFGGFVTWKQRKARCKQLKAKQGRRAHPGGQMKSNKAEARRKFEARKGIKLPAEVTNSGASLRGYDVGTFRGQSAMRTGPATSSTDRGNYLRKKHIKELYEAAGFIVVGDPQSQESTTQGGATA
jgi:hypothetical protein